MRIARNTLGLFVVVAVSLLLAWGTSMADGKSERLYPPSSLQGSSTPPAISVDTNGNVAMVGTVKHATGGDDWSIIYYEKGDEVPSQTTRDFTDCDTAYDVAQYQGMVLVAGSIDGGSAGKNWQVAEVNPQSGELVWQDSWDNNGNDDEAMAVAVDGGEAVVAGYTSDGTKNQVRIAAYDAGDGAKSWAKTLSRTSNDKVWLLDVGGSHMAVAGGSRDNGTSSWLILGFRTSDGAVLWEKAGGDLPTGRLLDMAVSQDGKVAAVGYTLNGTEHRWTAILLSSSGEVLWRKSLDADSEARGVAFDSLGRVVVAGYETGSSRKNVKVIWYDTAGDQVLSKDYDGGNDDEANGIGTDLAGNTVVTGYSYDGSYREILVLCYDSSGDLSWSDSVGDEANQVGYRVAISKTGESTVVGVSESVGGYEWKVVRYKGHVLSHTLGTAEVRQMALLETPDVANGNYLGLGSVANNGTELGISLKLPLYVDENGDPVAVNVYFAIAIGTSLYVLQNDGTFSATTVAPWKKGLKAPLSAQILPSFSIVNPITKELLLPAGDYVFYTLVVPSTVKDDLSDLKVDGDWELTYVILTLTAK